MPNLLKRYIPEAPETGNKLYSELTYLHFDDFSELRELIVPFGDSGYVAFYHHELEANSVYVLAFRHQKEADYQNNQ